MGTARYARPNPMPKHKHKREPTDFGRLLMEHLARLGISQRQFGERVSRPNTVINRVIYGERRPNPLWIPEWSAALDLDEKQAATFTLAARDARAKGKADSREYIEEITERLDTAEKAVSELWDILRPLLEREGKKPQMPKNVAKTFSAILLMGKAKP